MMLKMSMHHGHGSKHKNKHNKIGIILKINFMMIMHSKRNFMILKKRKICNHNYSTN